MRRTARALSVAVLASAALGLSAGVGAADPGVPPPPSGAGEPVVPPPADDSAAVPPPSAEEAPPPSAGQAAARVSPSDAGPGDTVTVSVSCGPTGGSAPASLDATSAAFEEGTVALRKVADDAGTASGPAYRGTARIAAAEDFAAERPPADTTDPGAPRTRRARRTRRAPRPRGAPRTREASPRTASPRRGPRAGPRPATPLRPATTGPSTAPARTPRAARAETPGARP